MVLFAVAEGFQSSWLANSYMLAAIVICGLGYAEGASLSRKLGGWHVISWALGGIASVGQLQLLQPFLGLMLAALLLGERISPSMLLCSFGVVLCVLGAKRLAR